MDQSKTLREEKDPGNSDSINNISREHKRSVTISLDEVKEEELSKSTEMKNVKSDSSIREKIKKFAVRKIPSKNKDKKTKVKIPKNFKIFNLIKEGPENLLNRKIKRNVEDDEINQRAITQTETNKKKKLSGIEDEEAGATKKIRYGNYYLIDRESLNTNNLMLEALKTPYPIMVKLVEDLGGIKLEPVNLDNAFGGTERNRAIIDLSLYKIICFELDEKDEKYVKNNNKEILENAKPKGERNKKLFEYLLTRKYKFLLDKYFNNEKNFDIDKETIEKFPAIDEVLADKFKNKFKNEPLEKEKKIKNLKAMTAIILDDFQHDWNERIPNKKANKGLDFKTKTIETFEGNYELNKIKEKETINLVQEKAKENESTKKTNENNLEDVLSLSNWEGEINEIIYNSQRNRNEENEDEESFISSVTGYYRRKNSIEKIKSDLCYHDNY